MTKRYWIAAFGNLLGGLLGVFLMGVMLVKPQFSPLCGLGFFVLGWGTHHFQSVMNHEFESSQ